MKDWRGHVSRLLWEQTHRSPQEASAAQWQKALATAVLSTVPPIEEVPPRCAAYFSAEFLMGRMIHANLLNTGLLPEADDLMADYGLSLAQFEELEDMALGNGGLGRLAACFLDSAATMGIPLHGYGIRYRFGLFRQHFTDGFQRETPDDWLKNGDPWSFRRQEERVTVRMGNLTVYAVPYDMPIIGYGAKTANFLRLWQAEPLNALDWDKFNEQKYDKAFHAANEAACLSAVLYPNDSTDEGKRLRLRQQYFFCSASLQDLLRRFRRSGKENLSDWLTVQLNDTHPAVSILELIRLLMEEEKQSFDDALDTAREVFAYTNHTVLPEALEKWDLKLFYRCLPQLKKILEAVDCALINELKQRGVPTTQWENFRIISGGQVHMARLAVFGSRAVNGVAALHTKLLTEKLMPHWHALYPQKFQNKTNGITQRRWLALANPALAKLITDTIGGDWITNLAELGKLNPYADDETFCEAFLLCRQQAKARLASYMEQREGQTVPTDRLFDVQAKRLHEYKRQLLNAFSILDIYYQLREGKLKDFVPTVFIFGAKAAPSYRRAKGIIKYIHELANMINQDPTVSPYMQVIFLTNYDVSYAEKLLPAADISEQISTAGMEASGTGNMKMMLNGALTLGTMDGANVEIFAVAGQENGYVFGASVEELAKKTDYDPKALYACEPRIRRVVDSLIDGTFSDGGSGLFRELYDALLQGASWHKPDQYYVLGDLLDFTETRLRANREYANRMEYARKCVCNIAASGRFSSDRTVLEYARDIWRLAPYKEEK